MEEYTFEYFSAGACGKTSFYMMPKALFARSFSALSCEAKILYTVMLDRMGMSQKNGWTDKHNRVYIYFTQEEAMERLGIGKNKCVKLFAKLAECGLIKRERQGLGKPMKIYVMCITEKTETNKFDNQTCGRFKSKSVYSPKTNSNNTEYNNTDINKKEFTKADAIREKETRASCVQKIKENIEYDILLERYSKEDIDGLVEIMADAVYGEREKIEVAREHMEREHVREVLFGLNFLHIAYVMEALEKNTAPVRNIKAYLLTALYNAPQTIGHYYTAQFNEFEKSKLLT